MEDFGKDCGIWAIIIGASVKNQVPVPSFLIFTSRYCSAGRVRSCKLQQSMVRVRAEIAIPIPIPILVNKTNVNHINKNMKLS